MIPDGDRRHCAESGGVVDEPAVVGVEHDVVGVLVLHDDALDEARDPSRHAPAHHGLEGRVAGDRLRERLDPRGGDGSPHLDFHPSGSVARSKSLRHERPTGGIRPATNMAIETVALIKLPPSVFTSLPRADGAPAELPRLRLKGEEGATYEARLLDDGALVYTPVAFGADPSAVLDALWDLLGDALADHDDDDGIFVLPSVANVGASTYDTVITELGEAGDWIAFDDVDDVEDDDDDDDHEGHDHDHGHDHAAEGDVVGPGDDFMSMMANITNSLGADTLMGLQQAMMSGDPKAFERAQAAVAAKLSQRSDLVDQLQGLVGAMPPELRDMAMNTSPDELMRQMQGAGADPVAAMRKLSDEKGRKR